MIAVLTEQSPNTQTKIYRTDRKNDTAAELRARVEKS